MKKSRLAYNILLWIMPVAAGAMVLAMVVFSQVMGGAVRRYAHDANRKAADIAALRVEAHMGQARQSLERLATQFADQPALMQRTRLLKSEILDSSSFRLLYFVDAAGRETVNSDPMDELRSLELEDFHHRALDGAFSQSEVKESEDDIPYMVMCAPVEKWREVLGALCGQVDFRAVWRVLDAAGVGDTGRALLIDERGAYLSHPSKARVFKHESMPPGPLKKMHGARGSFTDKQTGRARALMAYRAIPDFGWKAVVAQDYSEALAHYIRLRNILIAVSALMLGLVAAVCIVVARRVARPVEDLTAAVESVGASGDLSLRVGMDRSDEIGALAAAFDTMLWRLQQNRDLLMHTERLGAVGRFAAGVIHEVRNPVSGLLGYTYLLKKNPAPDQVAEFAADMETELNNINATLERLLDSARQREARFERISVNDVAEQAVKLLQHHLERFEKMVLELDLATGIPPVNGDARLLKQVLVNLLLNAAAAMDAGGVIRIATHPAGSGVDVTIRDNGRGMTAEQARTVFEPFVSGGAGRNSGGTGLGLYIAHEIVSLHRGTICVDTEPGRGTAFTIHLPGLEGSNQNG